MTTLADKTILVTRRIPRLGRAGCQSLCGGRSDCHFGGASSKRLEKVYDAIVAAGSPEPFAICFDLMSAEEKEFKQFEETIDEATGGKLDGVVHCASYFYALSPLDFQTVSEWVNQYRINTVAPMGLTRALFPLLKQSEDASVILSVKATAKNRKPIGAVSELLKPRLIICVKWPRTSGNVLTTCVPMFWCRVPSIRRNVSNPIRANRKANVKNTKMSCRNLFGGQAERAGGGQAKSSICKSTCSEWFENMRPSEIYIFRRPLTY